MLQDFFNVPRVGFERLCVDQAVAPTHAKDLFRRAYKAMHAEPWSDTRFPVRLRTRLAEQFTTVGPSIHASHESSYDHSVKFAVALADANLVEAVLMPEKQRLTLCISSQVGCAQACVFCHTGRMGLKRQLTAGEIVGQVVLANRWLEAHPQWLANVGLAHHSRVTNIVFMGMGEPLDNVEAVIDAIQILTDPYGFALGLRRISVSTSGHLDGIERIVEQVPGVRLALSVHSTDNSKRSKIMPINRRWPLATVLERLRQIRMQDQTPIMLQYTMIEGVNDTLAEASSLAAMTAGLNAKINLIPLNHVSTSRLKAPSPETIQAFRDLLHAHGLRVMVRYSKGQDIAAACGQLVTL